MKPIYFNMHSRSPENSFVELYAEIPHTYNKFHYHKEYEILYNIENSGTRFIGDSIQRFENGDLVLVGPHIPHYWRSDDCYFAGNEELKAKVIVIQFVDNFIGETFIGLPEMVTLKNLFIRATHGIRFMKSDAEKIGKKIVQISGTNGWKKMLLLIEMLCIMGDSKEYELLSSRGFTETFKFVNQEKLSNLFNYMICNYARELSLEEAAEQMNMNTSAFCRYFKKSTLKTFSQAMNEIRIGFACKEIINTNKSISEIAFDCGYINIPYFNRVFKRIKNVTPQQYRNIQTG